jgi:hypothetical protein
MTIIVATNIKVKKSSRLAAGIALRFRQGLHVLPPRVTELIAMGDLHQFVGPGEVYLNGRTCGTRCSVAEHGRDNSVRQTGQMRAEA